MLTASITKPNKKGKIITDLPLSKIGKPMLFVHNDGDKCVTTPLGRVKPIAKRLKAGLVVFSSRKKSGRHCGGSSPHGFLGIERQVIGKILTWIEQRL